MSVKSRKGSVKEDDCAVSSRTCRLLVVMIGIVRKRVTSDRWLIGEYPVTVIQIQVVFCRWESCSENSFCHFRKGVGIERCLVGQLLRCSKNGRSGSWVGVTFSQIGKVVGFNRWLIVVYPVTIVSSQFLRLGGSCYLNLRSVRSRV